MLTFAILLSVIVLGAHVRLPLQLARTDPTTQATRSTASEPARRWALVAAPLLLSTGILWLAFQILSPNLGLTNLEGRTSGPALATLPLETKIAALLFSSLLVTDLLTLLAWPKLDRSAWLLITALGLIALTGTAYAFNSIAFRVDPSSMTVVAETQGDFYIETSNLETVDGGVLGTLIRALLLSIVALTSAMLLEWMLLPQANTSTWLRFFPVLGAVSIAVYGLLLPDLVKTALFEQRDHLTGISVAILFGLLPWLPRRLRWAALGLGTALLAVLLHRIVLVA